MKSYQLTYLISPELKTEEAEGLALEIINFLQKEEVSVIKIENPKPKTLSFQIKKQESAFQAGLEFCSTPEKLKIIEEKIKKDPRILRYLIVIKEPPKKKREEKIFSTIKPSINSREIKEEKFFSAKNSDNKTEKKVELKDIEEKLEEILKE